MTSPVPEAPVRRASALLLLVVRRMKRRVLGTFLLPRRNPSSPLVARAATSLLPPSATGRMVTRRGAGSLTCGHCTTVGGEPCGVTAPAPLHTLRPGCDRAETTELPHMGDGGMQVTGDNSPERGAIIFEPILNQEAVEHHAGAGRNGGYPPTDKPNGTVSMEDTPDPPGAKLGPRRVPTSLESVRDASSAPLLLLIITRSRT